MSEENLLPVETGSEVQGAISRLQRNSQGVAHQEFKTKPLPAKIPDRGIVIVTDAGVNYIYTKINGKRYRVALTLDP